jgi:hypothetical protein
VQSTWPYSHRWTEQALSVEAKKTLLAVILWQGPDPSYTRNVLARSQDLPGDLVFGPFLMVFMAFLAA